MNESAAYFNPAAALNVLCGGPVSRIKRCS